MRADKGRGARIIAKKNDTGGLIQQKKKKHVVSWLSLSANAATAFPGVCSIDQLIDCRISTDPDVEENGRLFEIKTAGRPRIYAVRHTRA